MEKEYKLNRSQKFGVWLFFSFYCIWLVLWITQVIMYHNLYAFLGGFIVSVTFFPAMVYLGFVINYGSIGAKAMIQYLISTILRRTSPPLMVDAKVIERARKIRKRIVIGIAGFILVVTGFILIVGVVDVFSNGGSPGDNWYGRNVYQYQHNDTFGISFGELTGNWAMADLQPHNGQAANITYTAHVIQGNLTIKIEDNSGKVRWSKTTSLSVSGSIPLPQKGVNLYHLIVGGNHTKGKVDFKCSDADVTVTGLDASSENKFG